MASITPRVQGLHWLLVTGLLVLSGTAAHGQNLNIDFGLPFGVPGNSFGGAAGQAGVWNGLGLGVHVRLTGVAGTPTSVTATINADSDSGNAGGCSGDVLALTGDNLYSIGGEWSVVATGLIPGQYDLYVYEPYNDAVSTGTLSVNGVEFPDQSRGRTCTLTEQRTHVIVPVTLANGTLILIGKSTPGGAAGIAGLQLVQRSVLPGGEASGWTATTFAGAADWSTEATPAPPVGGYRLHFFLGYFQAFSSPRRAGGAVDASGTIARFGYPFGIAADADGTLFVADTQNHAIRQIGPDLSVTTLAGVSFHQGDSDGTGHSARFNRPAGIALCPDRSLYVADTYNNTIRRITRDGVVTTVAGAASQFGDSDGDGRSARFRFPFGITCDSQGRLFIADTQNHTIRRIGGDGVVTTIAGTALARGTADGAGAAARFDTPAGIVAAPNGTLYVADYGNHTIRRIAADGQVTTIAGSAGNGGSTDGPGAAARFWSPGGLTLDALGTLYVAELEGRIRKIAPDGVVTTIAGWGGHLFAGNHEDGVGRNATFDHSSGVAVVGARTLVVADQFNSVIRKMDLDTGAVTTIAGQEPALHLDGPRDAARVKVPLSIAFGRGERPNVYFVDQGPGTGCTLGSCGAVRRVDSQGTVSTVAIIPAARGIAVGPEEQLYVSTDRHVIYKVQQDGALTVLAGSDFVDGHQDGSGAQARFKDPVGLAIGATGDLFVADQGNHVIRKVSASGQVTTVAGTPTQAGYADGAAQGALFASPSGVAVTANGDLLVADTMNACLRKITPGGTVSTVAGVAGDEQHADGEGVNAKFVRPYAVVIDDEGSAWIADPQDHTIRRMTAEGRVSTIAGRTDVAGYVNHRGDRAAFNWPHGIAVSPGGEVLVADTWNNAIRRIVPAFDQDAYVESPCVTGSPCLVAASIQASTIDWRIVRRPAGAQATLTAVAPQKAALVVDVPGLYTLRAAASRPDGSTNVTVLEISVAQNPGRRRSVRH